ncbi:hypothetical protein OROMI_006157 [Orobanche minor]
MSNSIMGTIRDDVLLLFSGVHHHPSSSAPVTVTGGECYLLDGPQIQSTFGNFQSKGFLGGRSKINESEYGFSRPDFRQGPLVGTVHGSPKTSVSIHHRFLISRANY